MASWTHLIRFEATNGKVYFSHIDGPQVNNEEELTGYTSFNAAQKGENGEPVKTRKILSPTPVLSNEIICIGTNYRRHAEEAGLAIPEDPVMWYKPQSSLAGPGEIIVPKSIQDGFIDFEVSIHQFKIARFVNNTVLKGELTIVISKDCRDVSETNASEWILGYTIGNDLTARKFQDPKRAGGQFTRAKAFDNFAPVGPVLVSAKAFGSLDSKYVRTTVNGRELQNSPLDLIHNPAKLVSFLSQGTTLRAGTLIMTGTPPGVGWFQDPKVSLHDGDVVEVEITGCGKLSNTIRFE